MPDIKIREPHKRSRAQAQALLAATIDRLAASNGITGEFRGPDLFVFRATGASGEARVDDKNIDIIVDLTFFSRPFKADIEAGIRKELSLALADQGEVETEVLPPKASGAVRPTPSRSRLGGRQRPSNEIKPAEVFTGIAPAGPNLRDDLRGEIERGKEPEKDKPITATKKIAIGVGIVSGVTSLIIIPGPVGRVLIAAGAGYTTYRLVCDALGDAFGVVLGKCD